MSNRSLAFLILIGVCTGLLFFIYYFFIANVGSVTVDVGELENVKIELKGEYSSYPGVCNKKCIFEKIPPVKYSISIKKDSYKTIIGNFELKRSEQKELKYSLQKEIKAENLSPQANQKRLTIFYNKYLEQLKSPEKREIIGFYKELISYSSSGGLKIFSFDGALETEIFTLKETKIKKININDIDGLLFFTTEKQENYIYDIKKSIGYFITISEEIIFAKKTQLDNRYIINTDNGAYVYNINDNSKDKKTLFDDFVILKNNKILGLIKKDSINKLSILNIQNNNKNKLILHDIESKERKVIYESNSNIQFLLYNNGKIYLKSLDEGIQELKNLDL